MTLTWSLRGGSLAALALALALTLPIGLAGQPPNPDLNGDGIVDKADERLLKQAWKTRCGDPGFNPAADFNADCVIDKHDKKFLKQHRTKGPVAFDDEVTTDRNVPVIIAVLANDLEKPGKSILSNNGKKGGKLKVSIAILTPPVNGGAAVQPDGTIRYTPAAGFAGVDTFEYTIADKKEADDATVTVTVLGPPPPANQAPTVTLAAAPASGPAPLIVTFSTTAADPEGDALSYAWDFGDGNLAAGPGPLVHQYATAGSYAATVTVSDASASDTDTVAINVTDPTAGVPADPATVAPPIDPTVATDFAQATAFLYEGPTPIQTGVTPGTMEVLRAAVVRGRVRDRAGAPVPGVQITILDHPEFGETLSRADGLFDLAVNGGGVLTVAYDKAGFLAAQRQADVPWRDFVVVPDVTLVPLDTATTRMDFSPAAPVQVHRATPVTDADGTRQATLIAAPGGTLVTGYLPDGTPLPAMASLTIRATEYTVGPGGPTAMPAELPPTSAYTYAVELTADEILAAGATTVTFDPALTLYLENFRGFPVGIQVPTAYYDRRLAAWVPTDDGRVIQVLGMAGGLADLDADGDGDADAADAALLGATDGERQKLAQLYAVGQTLWRVPIAHFTPYDLNWGASAVAGAAPPGQSGPKSGHDNKLDDPNRQPGYGTLELENQVLTETLPVTGTPFSLTYASDSVGGADALRTLEIPLSGPSVPSVLKYIELEVLVGGRRFVQQFPAQPNQTHTFTWDGRDAYGRAMHGVQEALITLGYAYDGFYNLPPAMARSFGFPSGVPVPGDIPTREPVVLTQSWTRPLGGIDKRDVGVAGWSLDVHHAYDPVGRTMYQGSGRWRSARDLATGVAERIAGNGIGGYTGDGGLAGGAALNAPTAVAYAPDGSLYVADASNYRIRKVDPSGIITTIAGTGVQGFSGDGGPAISARIGSVTDIAVAPDGSVLIGDSTNRRIRRIEPSGTIRTLVGSGGVGPKSGPALQVGLSSVHSLAHSSDGSLYFAEPGAIYELTPDGLVRRIAGTGNTGFSGDGGPAVLAQIWTRGIALGPDGSLYLGGMAFGADPGKQLRRVGPDGIIETVAGGGTLTADIDGQPATSVRFDSSIIDVTVAADGTVYFNDTSRIYALTGDGAVRTVVGSQVLFPGCTPESGAPATGLYCHAPWGLAVGPDGGLSFTRTGDSVWRVGEGLPSFTGTEHRIASQDGLSVDVFDSHGRHLRTTHALTGATLYQFGYDPSGRLISVTDGNGNVTTIERDGAGNPTAIVAPFGQRTTLTIQADRYLGSATNPAGETTIFGYDAGGLLTSVTGARGVSYSFSYDAVGRLVRAEDPEGGSTTLTRSDFPTGHIVTAMTTLGRTTVFRVETSASGIRRRLTTHPDGTHSEELSHSDGRRILTRPDGTIVTTRLTNDPRFGMQAPILAERRVRLPSGLESMSTESRTATLADASDAFSLTVLQTVRTLNGRAFSSTYDAATRTRSDVTPEGRQTQTTLDTLGRVVRSQVGMLEPTTFTYDPRGLLVQTTEGSGAGAQTTSFAYHPTGWLASVTDPVGRLTQFQYDLAGRVVQTTRPDGEILQYAYDGHGNTTQVVPPSRPAHLFDYTARDLRASYTPPVVSGPSATQYVYDLDGALIETQRPDGRSVTASYDAAGRVSQVGFSVGMVDYTYEAATGQLGAIDALGTTVSYGYDGGLLVSTDWSGQVNGIVTRSYDSSFRLSTLGVAGQAVALQYDQDDLLTNVAGMALARDPANGLVTGSSFGNITDAWTYNALGEPIRYQAQAGGTPIFDVQYSYDALGRLTGRTEAIGAAVTTFGYSYDLAGRLMQVSENGSVRSTYTYDANGNRLTASGPGGLVGGTYDAQDRLTQYGTTTYRYLASGELASEADGASTTLYDYDELGNLRAVANGATVSYLADGLQRRVAKAVNGVIVQQFLYQDALAPIAELDGAGQLVNRFVYGTQANVPDIIWRGADAYRIISDHLGSPRLVVDATTGAVMQRLDYDEFGNVLLDTNPGFQPFGFAGGLYDPHTGLVRFGARDYDPQTGRWTAKDPILFDGAQANLYQYSGGDPVNLVDPSGRGPATASAAARARVRRGIPGRERGILSNPEAYNVVIRVDGQVQVKDAGSDRWLPVLSSRRLGIGDRVRTLEGVAQTRGSTGIYSTLGPHSDVEVTDDVSPTSGRIDLLRDKINRFFGPAEFEVETPNAILGTRG